MPTLTLGLMSILALVLASSPGAAHAAKKRKGKAAAAAAKEPPPAKAEEIQKLKGDFKWGMSTDEVVKLLEQRVRDNYAEELKKTINDPSKNARVRKQMEGDVKAVRGTLTEFKGQTTGYDVSIVDREFQHKTGESMLVAKEEKATRYLFFVDGDLYKMFVAFNKDLIGDRTFEEFAEIMQAQFGKGRPIEVEITRKEQTIKVLDHFEWKSNTGDGLRLVDRSGFYDVYCLVVYDVARTDRLAKVRETVNPKGGRSGDSLVNAVLNAKALEQDDNADIIDRLTGRDSRKIGEAPPDVVVPMPNVKAPTAAEVNRKSPGAAPASSAGEKPSKPSKSGGNSDTSGLDL